MYEVHVLQAGYSSSNSDGVMTANGTSTLIVGETYKVIVDTLSPWDKDLLVDCIAKHGLTPSDITHVVCTHGHPDHIGNNNLFTDAQLHIVGRSVYHRDTYYEHDFAGGKPYEIDGKDLYVIATTGHTEECVSVVVTTKNGLVCVAGDLFEKKEDIKDPSIWQDAVNPVSDWKKAQMSNRVKLLKMCRFIVPGHGPMFSVTHDMVRNAEKQLNDEVDYYTSANYLLNLHH